MKFTRKLMSVILAAVMVIGTLVVNASAAISIDELARNLPSGEAKSFRLSKYSHQYYRVVLSKKGTLELSISSNWGFIDVYVYDALGNKFMCSENIFSEGKGKEMEDGCFRCIWNGSAETESAETVEGTLAMEGTIKYELKKGTYYIELTTYSALGTDETTFKATYPTPDSADVQLSNITICMSVGDTITLEVDAAPSNTKLTWSSSKKSVATVSSKGKVEAIEAGTTIITVKGGSSSQKIKIVVKDIEGLSE